jgi:hypothetical protein
MKKKNFNFDFISSKDIKKNKAIILFNSDDQSVMEIIKKMIEKLNETH